RCPSCMADLDLLVDYVSHLQGGLERAENLTRAGELAQAVWTYLEVLEVDPDNATARQKVGQVVAAVRQFDRHAPGRRWLSRMRSGFFDLEEGTLLAWMRVGFAVVLIVIAFSLGYSLAPRSEQESRPAEPVIEQRSEKSLTGK